MSRFDEKSYKIFELFHKQWALVTAGTLQDYNTCTVAWGSMGTLWTRPGSDGNVITVYIYPSRYTCDYLLKNPTFTVSFFPPEYKEALGYLGAHSGRDGDKVAASGLTPVAMGDSVTFAQAGLTFLCRKIYQHTFSKDDIVPEMQAHYQNKPQTFPPDENGEWQSHWVFVGEILEADDRETLDL